LYAIFISPSVHLTLLDVETVIIFISLPQHPMTPRFTPDDCTFVIYKYFNHLTTDSHNASRDNTFTS
jgi:hypothetical protein